MTRLKQRATARVDAAQRVGVDRLWRLPDSGLHERANPRRDDDIVGGDFQLEAAGALLWQMTQITGISFDRSPR
jgi:hypothetical protein